MPTTSPALRYSPFASQRSIRTLVLLQNASRHAPVEVRLCEVDLDTKPNYEALSYVWDPFRTGNRAAISCDGTIIEVTENCEMALRYLRYSNRPRVLWVDAICIDQSSEAEKTHQVRLMGDVYSFARRVIVWLGEGSDLNDFAFAFLRTFKETEGMDQARKTAFVKEKYEGMRAGLRLLAYSLNFFGPLTLCQWFKRVWTLQEIALAQDALVVFGEATITWDLLTLAVRLLKKAESDAGQHGNVSALYDVMSAHMDLKARITVKRQGGEVNNRSSLRRDEIASALVRPFTMEATMDHDRVFAQHGVLALLGASLPAPDYRRPANAIFTEAAKLAIQQDGSLNILNFVNGLEREADWPSWVPTYHEFQPPSPLKVDAFHAAGATSLAAYRFSANGLRLTVRGTRIGHIARRSLISPYKGLRAIVPGQAIMLQPRREKVAIHAWFDWAVLFLSWGFDYGQSKKYGTTRDAYEAWYGMILQDFTLVSDEHAGATRADFLEGFGRWQQYLLAKLHGQFGDIKLPDTNVTMATIDAHLEPHMLRPDWVDWDGQDWEGRSPDAIIQTEEWKISRIIHSDAQALIFHTQAQRCCRAKHFFITSDGWIGTAPASIEIEDMLILVSGVPFPLVVRPVVQSEGSYELLGPAYIQGVMHGELWPENEDSLEDFTFV